MNYLNFTKDLSTVYAQARQKLFISPSNRLTSWWLDISEFTTQDLSAITVTLTGISDVDFKSIIPVDQLIVSGNYLIYKNSKKFTTDVTNEYYLEITDGTTTIYSNLIFFH